MNYTDYRYIALFAGLFVVLIMCAGCVSETANASDLTYYTEQYPPYNYEENGTLRGIAVDLLVDATGRMGSPVKADAIRLVPWTEGYREALGGSDVVLFSTVRLPERENLFKWAGPIAAERKVVFARSESGISIGGPGDLAGYRIGVVTDDAAIGELSAMGVNPDNLVSDPDPSVVLGMLLDGKIDLFVYGKEAGEYLARDRTGGIPAIKVVYRLGAYDLYYAFGNETPDAVVEVFQSALDEVKNIPDDTGVTEYQRILYRYIEPGCARQTVTAAGAMELVNLTAADIGNDAAGTLALINAGEHPYLDAENPAKYVFVYDTDVTIVAEADNPAMAGLSVRGKTDVAGTPFRDRIVEGALRNGSGWVDYVYMSPAEAGLFYKTAYYTLVEGSDGNSYVVCCGIYKPCV